MGLYDNYPLPAGDGAVTLYENKEAIASGNFQKGKSVIFVNGMANDAEAHRQSAVELSLLLMQPVHGLFNKTDGEFTDFLQCIADKYQFDGPMALSAKNDMALGKNIIDFLADKNLISRSASKVEVMRGILSRNKATLGLFNLLRSAGHRKTPIYAHSQGNLILANALSAIAAVDGEGANAGREVHSFGSPTVNWPKGLKHQEYAFTGDGVALLAGFDFSFKISKLGNHTYDKNFGKAGANGKPMKPEMAKTWLSHGFLIYIQNNPAFVVNRFRWGSWGLTFNMDEEGLAEALVSMGTNLKRVKTIFEHLDDKHNSDADDVAYLYVEALRKNPAKHARIIHALRMDKKARELLIRLMEEGWTTSSENKAIAWIRSQTYGA